MQFNDDWRRDPSFQSFDMKNAMRFNELRRYMRLVLHQHRKPVADNCS